MAYQNVGTPRFYINVLEWLYSTASISFFRNIYRTLPVDQDHGSLIWGGGSYDAGNISTLGLLNDKSFFAVLGHDLAGTSFWFSNTETNLQEIVNFNADYAPSYMGFSMATFNGTGADNIEFSIGQSDKKTGSAVVGTYYDMPHSPDLKLTMTREMDGVKKIRTKGGVDLVNHRYIKPALWGDAGAWELYSGTPNNTALSRTGRRLWDLSFSHLQDSDIFPDVSSLSNYGTSGYGDGDDVWANTLLDDNTFFGQVIHKTNGGQLPFIFQPCTDSVRPDINDNTQFAICKFDMNTFEFRQVANGVYNVKLKIREVW